MNEELLRLIREFKKDERLRFFVGTTITPHQGKIFEKKLDFFLLLFDTIFKEE